AAALRFFWLFHTHVTEGHKWIRTAFEMSAGASSQVRSKLLNGLGVGARIQGDYETANVMHSQALAASHSSGDKWEIALSHRGLGAVASRQGDYAAAQKHFEKTLEISRKIDDMSEIGYSLGSLGNLARAKGENVIARELLDQSLATFRHLGQTERVITNLLALGHLAISEGNLPSARPLFEEALLLAQQLKDRIHISDLLDGNAAIASEDNPELSATIAGAADQMRRSIGYEPAPAERRFREEYIGRLKAKLNEALFADLYERGLLMKPENTIALVIDHDLQLQHK
ncbi:MAG: tetratricopeptide repeat protein, partial [Pyrinomonadaceae bacterium]